MKRISKRLETFGEESQKELNAFVFWHVYYQLKPLPSVEERCKRRSAGVMVCSA